jgi:hypothetical protein
MRTTNRCDNGWVGVRDAAAMPATAATSVIGVGTGSGLSLAG